MNKSTQQYELTFILGEKASSEDATAKAETLTAAIAKFGGTVTKSEFWGRRELAYEIKRNRTGVYVTLWFDAPSSAVKPLEQEMRFDESIIRFLTTKAYVEAQPGTLFPVVEEEKDGKERKGRGDRDKAEGETTGEETLRRASAAPVKEDKEEESPAISEEERLEKLDAALGELLKEDQE